MTIFRASIGFQLDSTLPRDIVTINPHYNGADAQALANALKANLSADPNVSTTTPFVIKIYDAKKQPPSYPLATASQGTGSRSTGYPREIALCLSYYGGFNRPGFRGRMFLPAGLLGAATMGLRPSTPQMTTAMTWKSILGAGLPANTFWTVWSRTRQTDAQVTNVWVDDEWDTMRSRGLRGTTRQLGTVP